MKLAIMLLGALLAWIVFRYGLPHDDERIGLPAVDGDFEDAGW